MSQASPIHGPGINGSGDTESEGKKRPHILLVEGDGFTRLVLLVHLRLAGFGVDFTSNGILGLGKLRSCHPDILLLDLKLCGLSGVELIRAARTEPTFGNRPICVFTHADRMTRSMRKEVRQLDAKIFDKGSITREALVQAFAAEFLARKAAGDRPLSSAGAEPPAEALNEMLVPGMIEEIIAGVRDQSEQFAKCTERGKRKAAVGELLSRVSSLASCAEVARLLNLARHARVLEDYLKQLWSTKQGCGDPALSTIRPAIEVLNRMSLDTTGKEQKLARFNAVVVDEAPGSNRALKQALLRAGFEPVCFHDPPRAREYLASNRTDLIITNLVLPEAHSLALKDIRRLSLHAKTPAVFGAESTLTASLGDELPPRASRMDIEPCVLTELVLQALNAVQGSTGPKPAAPMSKPSPPGAGQPFPVSPGVNAASGLPFRNDSGVFSEAMLHQEGSAVHAPAQNISMPAEEIFPPFSWSVETPPQESAPETNPGHSMPALEESEQPADGLSVSGNIHHEPSLQAQSDTTDADPEAELVDRLPAETPLDASQVDERPLEELLLSHLQEEATEPSQPEPTVEGQPFLTPNIKSESDQNAITEIHLPTEATPNYEEAMNNPLQAAPAEWPQTAQAGEQVLSPHEQETHPAESPAQDRAAEMESGQTQVPIEQKDEAKEPLQEAPAKATPMESSGQASVEESKAQARCVELEAEVSALRQALEGFNDSFGQEQQAAAKASRQVHDLEERLKQNAAELETLRQDQQRATAELRLQQEGAEAAGRQSEATRQQAEDRCAQLEQELGSLRQSRDELAHQLAEEQKANADAMDRLKKFEAASPDSEGATGAADGQESQVGPGIAALARATAELAKERGERQRSDQRAAELNGRLQAMHEDLRRTLQAQHEDQAHLSVLEEQERQSRQMLEQRSAELEQLQDERRSAKEELQKAKELNARLREDLSFFEGANKKLDGAQQELQSRLEANLNAARENEARIQQENSERRRLAETLESTNRELQDQVRKREALEQQLLILQNSLQDREARLQKETAERQQLQQDLDSLQRGLLDNSERDLEVSKLQSALHLEQVERRRQESQLARMRRSALDAARAARALRTSLRRQIREPVDSLLQSTRSLLELETGEEQRKLAEAVLQHVILVQTRLREPESTHDLSPEAAGLPTPAAE